MTGKKMIMKNTLWLSAVAVLWALPVWAKDQQFSQDMDEIVVTSQRQPQSSLLHAGNVAVLDATDRSDVNHQHIHELMTRVAGVWVSRGSGQEHLTAIRSPVLTGAGACGGFLLLEDGIPVRPAGFCNVNQMFELFTEQAQQIEVIRGPGNALYGSNALHGVVNVLMPVPGDARSPSLAFELGANQFYRLSGQVPFDVDSDYVASFTYAKDGGFRDDSGYRQAKVNLKGSWPVFGGEFVGGFTATDLAQDTAGFILGEDAYKDPAVNRSNANPEAFRDAISQRLYGLWTRSAKNIEIDVRPYLRHSRMDFLQHFLPGKPLEENGHVSVGALSAVTFGGKASEIIVGLDLEYADSFLRETQDGATEGSDFLVETRPEGKHYDYDAKIFTVSPFIQSEWSVNDKLTLHAGLRLEYLRYDYRNRMLSGNTRDDGSVCGFGGCLYTRPESRSDSFSNIAPKLSAIYAIDSSTSVYANLARGFRAPQATELYRLQNGQQVADLNSVRIDSVEFGVRSRDERFTVDLSAYFMKKKNSILRDSEGFNVSGGSSRHSGIEAKFDWQWHPSWTLSSNVSYGRHSYDFDLVAARGETFVSGRDIDTAPRWLGSIELGFDPDSPLSAALQWSAIGEYFLDAENRFSYPGHELLNIRVAYEVTPAVQIVGRLNNLADERVADRADYAFGNYRYFPGRGRELSIELRYAPPR